MCDILLSLTIVEVWFRFNLSLVTISPKYQVVIQSVIRKNSDLKSGMKIVLVPIQPLKKLKGAFKDLLTPNIKREKSDRPL